MARDHSFRTDEAGVGPDPRLSRHLLPLREARRYRLTRGEPDIRGWAVYTSNGREVGRVGDLLVDPSIGEVVMFDVNRSATGDQTVAPLRAAWIDRDNKRVILDSAHLAPSDELPSLGRTPLTQTSLEEVPPERHHGDVVRSTQEYQREVEVERGLADTGESHTSLPTPPSPGTEQVVERRVVPFGDRPPSASEAGPLGGAVEAADERAREAEERTLIEEVVIRRRYANPEELRALSDAPPEAPPADQ